MFAVVLGFSSALIFGGADFLGGLAAKRLSAVRVTAIVTASGLALQALALLVLPGTWSVEAVIYGGVSGVTGAIAITLLYACLAMGPMSILSPLTAVMSALVPMTVGLVRGDPLAGFGYLGLGLALAAVILVGFVPERNAVRPRPLALLMAVVSGAMIGTFLVLIDLTPPESGLVPLVMNRAVNLTVLAVVILLAAFVARRRVSGAAAALRHPGALRVPGVAVTVAPAERPAHAAPRIETWWHSAVALATLGGMVDALANIVLLLALRAGELTVVSVLTALYPAGTIILAAVILRERIAPVQIVGLVLAIAAAGLLAIA